MPGPSPSARGSAILLALLLGSCILLMSVQVRRPGGHTLAEEWALDTTALLVRTVTGARAGIAGLSEWLSTRTSLVRDNAALRRRVEALEAEVLRLRDADRERLRLVALSGSHPTPPPGTRTARIVVVASTGPFRSAVLDRGQDDGIEAGGAVVGVAGLLGRVVATASSSARVQLISDRSAATGILLQRTGRVAVARGDGVQGVGLQYVPTIWDVKEGDVVVTAGTDGVYPRDLPVGVIAGVGRTGSSLFLDLPVRLAADPQAEPLVFVLPPVLPPGAVPARAPVQGPARP